MRINLLNLLICFVTTFAIVQYVSELFPSLDWFHLAFLSYVLTFLFPLPIIVKKESSK